MMPTNHCVLAGINLRIKIIRRDDAVQHTADNLRCIVLVRDQDIRQFPVKFAAFLALQAADDAGEALPAFQQEDPLTGIPIG